MILKDKYLTYKTKTKKKTFFLCITVLNKHKVSKNLGQFLELFQTIVDVGNLFQCFTFFCSEGSDLSLSRFVNIVLLNRDIVSCLLVF